MGRRLYLPSSMLNDRSSILSFLETRRSGKPRELVGPGPSIEEMERSFADVLRFVDETLQREQVQEAA